MKHNALAHVWLLLISTICVGVIVSCSPIGTPSNEAKIDIPTAWKTSAEGNSKKISRGWVKDLNDPKVQKLVDEATQNNPNILAAAERLKASRSAVVRSRANRIPAINGSTGGNRTRSNADVAGGRATSSGSKNINIGANWEIDLWGRLRHLHTAANANYEATVADFRGARLSLAANTASTWYNLISSENQVKLAKETLGRFTQVEKIIERNYKAGTARALDLQLSRNNVYGAEGDLRARLSDRDDARRNLEILLGRYPSATIVAPTDLPQIPQSVPSGLPSELIARRPDIVAARLDLEASFHLAKASKKDLLPSLTLNGSGSTNSSNFSDLLNPSFLTSSISTSLSQSIFQAGANREDARADVAQNKAAIHDYVDVVLDAYREVESAIASETWLKEEEFFLRKELQQAAQAERQAERDYAEGVDGVDILDLLESQRRASLARSSLIDLQNQRIQNRINLYLALGGDFSTRSTK